VEKWAVHFPSTFPQPDLQLLRHVTKGRQTQITEKSLRYPIFPAGVKYKTAGTLPAVPAAEDRL
jgi:hypothetical protein